VRSLSPETIVYLETPRLILRRLTPDDAEHLFALDSDPEVMRYLPGEVAHSVDQITYGVLPRYLSYYEYYDHYGFFAAIERSTGAFLGWFHIRPYREVPTETEIGYRFKPSAWGRGYASEGSRALIRKAFTTLGASKIVADTLAQNVRSRRVMEAVGMHLVKEFVCDEGEFPDRTEPPRGVKYALSRKEWEDRSPPASA
jgi:RimJ/RimL family protein N-acetyltransferase